MSTTFKIASKGKFENQSLTDKIEIIGFNKYSLRLNGNEITSDDSSAKKLLVDISPDGFLTLSMLKTDEEIEPIESSIDIPLGFEQFHSAEASKSIRGARGRYLYFKNPEEKSYIAYVISSADKVYKINLGSLKDPESTISIVLKTIPDKPFYKAQLNDKLPNRIVENRQPIKAALDVLEKEGFVRKTGKKHKVAEEYERTNKPIPKTTSIDNYAS